MRFPRLALALIFVTLLSASDANPPARFNDPQRLQKLESALPQIDAIFQRFAATRKITGMVWGVVIEAGPGAKPDAAHLLAIGNKRFTLHVGSTGVRDRATGAPVDAETVFRIASMTKSFTALAILKLRDEGKLSLEDPVSKWIPEFAQMPLPTRDSAPLRIRNLLSHSAGFPEDNPWGDQQLAASDEDLTRWLKRGIPFSTPPDTRYEYSNYAFGLLGRVVTQASGVPYDRYVQREILDKLGMSSSTFEFASIPAAKRATGYRLKPDGTYQEEPPLPHGAFGSMGGLLTTANDLGRYIAFHLSAWPPRDDAEAGPVRRSSVREMHHLWRPGNLSVSHSGGQLQATSSGYGYGLRVSSTCRFEQVIGHGGGLPGFGSYMLWLPDYGVGVFAMTNLTYAGPTAAANEAIEALYRTGGLQKRETPASPVLTQAREHIWNLWNQWNDAEAKSIAAGNFFLDATAADRQAEIRSLKKEVGACSSAGPVIAENWLRGQFNLQCEKGTLGVFFSMAPTQPPAVQHLAFQKLASGDVRLSAPTGAPAGVSCVEN